MPSIMKASVLALLGLALAHSVSALYTSSGPVTQLDPSNFQQRINAGGVWMVEFYAPWCGHCKSMASSWEKTAQALKGIVNVAAVDASEHQSLAGEYGVKGFPTIKLMYSEGGKIKAVDYNGARETKDFINFAMDKSKALALKRIGEKASSSGGGKKASGGGAGGGDGGFYSGTQVVTLTEDNFSDVLDGSDLWFVEFYAPWCGHCKSLKPTWIEAAEKLDGKVKVGAVDCTANEGVCGKYGVRGYPTIKFFGANKKRPEDFQGGRDLGSIVEFANKKWAAAMPPPEVKELVDQATFQSQCLGGDSPAKQLCFLAFLPNIMDTQAAGRNRYIGILQKLADQYKDRPFSYSWVEGGQQDSLEANVGVGGFGYPALVALNPKDKKFVIFKSAFEFDHMRDFIEGLRLGGSRETIVPIVGDLASLRTIAPWDGKDAEVIVEDEFSLDDIMGEDSGKDEL